MKQLSWLYDCLNHDALDSEVEPPEGVDEHLGKPPAVELITSIDRQLLSSLHLHIGMVMIKDEVLVIW